MIRHAERLSIMQRPVIGRKLMVLIVISLLLDLDMYIDVIYPNTVVNPKLLEDLCLQPPALEDGESGATWDTFFLQTNQFHSVCGEMVMIQSPQMMQLMMPLLSPNL